MRLRVARFNPRISLSTGFRIRVIAPNRRRGADSGEGDWIFGDSGKRCSTEKLSESNPMWGNADEVESLAGEFEVSAGSQVF